MMATLASIALILSASYSGISHAFQPASVSPFRQRAQQRIPLAARTAPSSSSLPRLRRNLSESTTNAAVEEDTTFFTRASRQAARERYEMLLSGEDPFGLFGEVSTTSVDGASPAAVNSSTVDSRDAAAESRPIVSKESTSGAVVMSIEENGSSDTSRPPKSDHDSVKSSPPSSIGNNSENGVNGISDSQYSDLLSTISESENNNDKVTGDLSEGSLESYDFQRRLLEARLTMESKKTASPGPSTKTDTPKEAEIKIDPWSVSAQGALKPKEMDISSSQPAAAITAEENVGGAGCIRKVEEDSTVEKVTYRNQEELHRDMFPNEEKEEEETMMAGLNSIDTSAVADASSAVHQETSTINEDHDTFEEENTPNSGDDVLVNLPSDASPSTHVIGTTELREENIAMGLLVMTRSLLTLKQAIDSKRDQGK
eukprot:CCRYP_015721-RA/>CCRYP_015721-RA protein AED:0.19 eAED:0.19 QI:1862/1/1/1/1/1/2/11/427